MVTYQEDKEQQMLVRWFRLQYPDLKSLLVHIPNGQNVGAITGARLKKAGLCKGFPDLMLAVTTCQHPGLFIEMKTKTGRLSSAQKCMHFQLENQRYKVVTAYGWSEAMDAIKEYLKGYVAK